MPINYKEYGIYLKALSDETRIRIFEMLAGGELCACKILEEFKITQPTLSYHMKILCESNLVVGRREGVWMKYSLNKNTLIKIQGFFDGIALCLENNQASVIEHDKLA